MEDTAQMQRRIGSTAQAQWKRSLADKLQETQSDQTYTEESLLKILSYAESLQQQDKVKTVLSQLPSVDETENYSEKTLQEMANTLGISEAYLHKAKDALCISTENQLEKLRELNAKPSPQAIGQVYKSALLKALKTAFPSEEITTEEDFATHQYYYAFSLYRIQKASKRPWWRLCKYKKKELASMLFRDSDNIDTIEAKLYLKDKFFTSICAETLKKLIERYSRLNFRLNFSAEYHYKI